MHVTIKRTKTDNRSRCNLSATPGVTPMGAPHVGLIVTALDNSDISSVPATFALSSDEAREVARRLVAAADAADAQARGAL